MDELKQPLENSQASKPRESGKIFCILFQRTGTKSLGGFFRDHGFQVATFRDSFRNGWTKSWFRGDFETIFASERFQSCSVFEDDPWWCGDFYKYLFHRFPDAKFVLFTREPDTWFNSMLSHSKGKTLGNTYIHAHLYRREEEYRSSNAFDQSEDLYSGKIDNLLPLGEAQRDAYTAVYRSRNSDIVEFFRENGPERIFVARLEDHDKWTRLGQFLGIDVDEAYDSHLHKSAAARGANATPSRWLSKFLRGWKK